MNRLVPIVFVLMGSVLMGCSLPTGDIVHYGLDDPELASASVNNGVWESTPWADPDAPWIPYTARLTVELEHTLGYTPSGVLVYLAFDPEATDPALAAGDLARIVDVTDTMVAVKNDTNGEYFVRVVAF